MSHTQWCALSRGSLGNCDCGETLRLHKEASLRNEVAQLKAEVEKLKADLSFVEGERDAAARERNIAQGHLDIERKVALEDSMLPAFVNLYRAAYAMTYDKNATYATEEDLREALKNAPASVKEVAERDEEDGE